MMTHSTTARPEVTALLSQIIDYAGLFPPAQHPLKQALDLFVEYLDDHAAWLLGNFVVPAKLLEPLRQLVEEKGKPLSLSVVAQAADKETGQHLTSLSSSLLSFSALELTLPPESSELPALLTELPVSTYLEVPRQGAWRATLQELLENLKRQERTIAIKCRCGGAEASHVPSLDELLFTITLCRDYGVPMKFTAGLHHPIRHYNEEIGRDMHGFLNVFATAFFAYHLPALSQERLLEVLQASSFVINEQGLHHEELHLSTSTIEQLRKNSVHSFGSCSFLEPKEDLTTLGLL